MEETFEKVLERFNRECKYAEQMLFDLYGITPAQVKKEVDLFIANRKESPTTVVLDGGKHG